MYHFRLLILCTLGWLGLLAPLPAQIVISPVNGSSSQFEFSGGNALPPLVNLPGMQPAYYHFFWEFGDGYFGSSPSPEQHLYRKSVSGTQTDYSVRRRNHAIYTTSAETPPIELQVHTPVVTDPLAPDSLMYDQGPVSLQASWMGQVRLNDPLTVVLLYQLLGQSPTGGGVNGEVSLFYHKGFIEPQSADSIRTHHGEDLINIGATVTGDTRYNRKAVWAFGDLLDARSIFIDMQVKPAIPKNASVIYLKMRMEYKGAGSNPVVHEQEISFSVGTAKDPNFMYFEPACIERSAPPQVLTSKVGFHNEGNGLANKIIIDIPVPKGIDPTTVNVLDAHAGQPGSFVPRPGGYYVGELNIIRFTFQNANMPGLQTPGLVQPAATHGHVIFEVMTDPSRYPPEDSFATKAAIVFNTELPVITPTASVQLATKSNPCEGKRGEGEGQDDPDRPIIWTILAFLAVMIVGLVLWLIRENNN